MDLSKLSKVTPESLKPIYSECTPLLLIVKTRLANQVPSYLTVRSKISEKIYTAEASYETYQRLKQDTDIESIEVSKKLIIDSLES